jgi:hypothetical protein
MKTTDTSAFLNSLGVIIPPYDEFLKLGDMTALHVDNDGQYHRVQYERGMILYGIIAKYRPKAVLDFGTGRGFGCLCMAWAMEDCEIPGKIFTLDYTTHEKLREWSIQRDSNGKPTTEFVSRQMVWDDLGQSSWLKHIETLTWYSSEIMSKKEFPKIEFCYVDGAHFYEGVKHDFYAFLKIAAEDFSVLFDDYAKRQGYGVNKFVDDEISNNFETVLIRTDINKLINALENSSDPDAGMVWIESKSLKQPLTSAYPEEMRNQFLKKYQLFEKRLKIRDKLNEKIPILRKVKFSKYLRL